MKTLFQRNAVLNLVYFIPLLLWLLPSLYFADWNESAHSLLFGELRRILIFCQLGVLLISLLDVENISPSEIIATQIQTIFFPAPLLVLAWLSGQISIEQIIFAEISLIIVATVITLFFIGTRILFSPLILKTLLFIMLLMLWNFRYFWMQWARL
jgi:hypothetical protein